MPLWHKKLLLLLYAISPTRHQRSCCYCMLFATKAQKIMLILHAISPLRHQRSCCYCMDFATKAQKIMLILHANRHHPA